MDKQHIRNNLERIVRLAQEAQIPGNKEKIVDLCNNAMYALERLTDAEIKAGIIITAVAQATRPVNGMISYEDLNLMDWAALEAHKLCRGTNESTNTHK